MNNRRDRGDTMTSSGGGMNNNNMPVGGRGLGGGVWLTVQGLPRDWREMDVFRAMEKRYGKVNQVRRSSSSEREALIQFVGDTDAKFVWHLREIELYDRTCVVDLAKPRGRTYPLDDASPPIVNRGSGGGGGFVQSRMGNNSNNNMQGNMRRQLSTDRQRDNWNDQRQFVNNNNNGNFNNNNAQQGNGAVLPVTHLPPEEDEKATRTLFVGNLEYAVTESMLRSTFSKYGNVQDVDIKRPMQGSGNAYAFVRFLHLDMAYQAKVALSGSRIGNYQCKIGYGKTNPTTRVWVGGLNYPGTASDLDENRLFEEFDRFGQIKKIDYVRGEHYGYVTFASITAAQEAVSMMRGSQLKISGDRGAKKVQLRVDYADVEDPYLPKLKKGDIIKRRADGESSRGGKDSDGKNESRPRRRVSRSASGSPVRDAVVKSTKRRRSSIDAESEPEERIVQKRARDETVSPPPKLSTQKSDDRSKRSNDDNKRTSDGKSKPDAKRRTTETLAEFRNKSETVWRGSVVLKSTVYPISSHLLRGPISWLNEVLSQGQELQITRRLRLEEEKLKDVTDKMNFQESATLMCFDTPAKNGASSGAANASHMKPLKHLQSYLLEKDAAGVINANQAIIYIFPSCSFASKIINEDMPTLVLPENGANVRDEDLGMLMVVSNPHDAVATAE